MSLILPRRNFLIGLAAGIAAPCIIKTGLMDINSLRNRLVVAFKYRGSSSINYQESLLNMKTFISSLDYEVWKYGHEGNEYSLQRREITIPNHYLRIPDTKWSLKRTIAIITQDYNRSL